MVRVPQVLLNATPPKPKKALLIGMIKGIMVVDNPLIGSDSLKGKALEGDGPLRMKKVGRIWDEGLSWRFLYSHNMPY